MVCHLRQYSGIAGLDNQQHQISKKVKRQVDCAILFLGPILLCVRLVRSDFMGICYFILFKINVFLNIYMFSKDSDQHSNLVLLYYYRTACTITKSLKGRKKKKKKKKKK